SLISKMRGSGANPAPTPAPAPAAPAPTAAVVNAAGVPGTMVEGHGLRFSVPAEGTLQFLPGRFEIGSGLDAGREIRFVHVPGPNGMEVTFGRSEGELYRHIQLRDKTVSRQHARMQLREGKWYLVNLSQTNPVAYNGTELESEREQMLADGDRIEMGEVVFTFRSR
ncbi:MAG: FHA domain-containing protein, partial [Gemmatimonadaceae bacterium]|nr:FHA domain-containing protein [Gemmatimonadaceae bacterium]